MIPQIKLYLKSIKPLMLRHHPDCKEYDIHTFSLGKYHLCIGCFIGYPVAFLSIIGIYVILQFLRINSVSLFVIGFIFMLSFLLSPLKLTNHKPVKILQKTLFNIGGAFIFWSIWKFSSSLFFNLILFLLLFSILFTLVNIYHAYSLYKTCKACQYNLKWECCPGFKDYNEYCEKNNLPNPFLQYRLRQMKE